jgi:hypothetical protein
MTGLGNYYQSSGVYLEEAAKARAIDTNTMLKWNKAVRERQRALDAQRRKDEAEQRAEDAVAAQKADIENGVSLNEVLDEILEFNTGSKAYAASTPVTPDVIRDIPFESRSEAITICLDQMTADDAWPEPLQAPALGTERRAVQKAVDDALAEDTRGNVSSRTMKKVHEAIADLRTKYVKTADDATIDFAESDAFLKTLASLTRMLNNPRLKKVVAKIEEYKEGDVGDLIAFMHSFNLRFAPAVSDRQKEIYQTLYPKLVQVRDDVTAGKPRGGRLARDENGKPLREAARDAWKGMDWKHIEAQDKDDDSGR